jgi:hypothetical protein
MRTPSVGELKKLTETFKQTSEKEAWQEREKISNEIPQERLKDLRFKNKAKKSLSTFVSVLLVLQNITVFGLVIVALLTNKLSQLELVFSVLIGATLAETSYLMKVIFQYVFSASDYSEGK